MILLRVPSRGGRGDYKMDVIEAFTTSIIQIYLASNFFPSTHEIKDMTCATQEVLMGNRIFPIGVVLEI